MKAEAAEELVRSFERDNEDAYRLAVAASLAVRVEPELVRAMRLKLFDDMDAGAEAELWFSPLVRTQTPRAMEFMQEVVAPLRRALARDQALLGEAWELLKKFHEKAPLALKLEEELTWLGLSKESNESVIEGHLRSVIEALKHGRRAGLARWAARALPSLPAKARGTEAARRLSLVAGLQSGVGPVLSSPPDRALPEQWLKQFMPEALGRVKVGVRLIKREPPRKGRRGEPSLLRAPAAPREDALPMLVEFSHPPAPSADQIEVPDTYRLLLEVSWGEGEGRRLRQLSLYPNETQLVEVGYGEVRIRTAVGDTHTLRTRFEYDFLLLYNRADEEFAKQLSDRLAAQEYGRGEKLILLDERFTYGSGVPDFLPLEATFTLSRRVGFVTSKNSAYDINALETRWRARPEPSHLRDWLVPIRVGPGTPREFPGSAPAADFRADFEAGFRSLWKTLTGEELPLPKPEPAAAKPVSLFYVYSHRDEMLKDQLEKHLSLLRRTKVIGTWYDHRISPGREGAGQIDEHVKAADIILLLVSLDFIASDYSYDVELALAMERHETGEARVVPVILRPCMWKETPFGRLQALPRDAKPVTKWRSRDEAFNNIAEGIRRIAEELQAKRAESAPRDEAATAERLVQIPRPPIVGFVPRRDKDGRDLVELLRIYLLHRRSRLVALWGRGGVGKTTLAAEVARLLADSYGVRVVWSSAEGRADYSLSSLLDAVAIQIGRTYSGAKALRSGQSALVEALARGRTLVVIDNFETIEPVEQSRCLAFLHDVNCPVLITSRARVEQARSVVVAGMSPEEAQEFIGRLVSVTAAPHRFTTTVRRRIAEAAEGNPLVIQWAVGQIALAQEPETVLRGLASGEGEPAERVFERAFNLPQVTNDARVALLALALFNPSASRPALAAVAGFETDTKRLDDAVKRLADVWLVETAAEGRRLALAGLTRSMARARLSQKENAGEYRRRFFKYFADYAAAHSQPTPEDFDALEEEKDNLLEALKVGFERFKSYSDDVQRMAASLTKSDGYLFLRGYWDDAERVCLMALEAARAVKHQDGVALFLMNLAAVKQGRGETDEAERLLSEASVIVTKLGDSGATAAVTLQLAQVRMAKGDLKGSETSYWNGLKHYEDVSDRQGEAVVLNQLGNLYVQMGDYREAEKMLNRNLAMSKEVGDMGTLSVTLNNLGQLAQRQGDLKGARLLYNESLEIQRRLGDQSGVADSLFQLGSLGEAEKDFAGAQRLYEESLSIYRRLGSQHGLARALRGLGSLAREQADFEEARRLYEESLEIARRLGDQTGTADTLLELGQLSQVRGDKSEAVRLSREALKLLEKIKSPELQRARERLAEIEGARPRPRPRRRAK